MTTRLEPKELYTPTDPSFIPFETTRDAECLNEIIGQARAVSAIEFGTEINRPGYNLFVLGPPGVGKQSTVRQYLEKQAATESQPDDWCYVNNFNQPHKPYALHLPAGRGRILCDDVARLIAGAKSSIPVAFESDEYRARHDEIEEKYEGQRKENFDKLVEEAASHNVSLARGPRGFILGPIIDNKVIDVDEFKKLPEEQQEHISEIIEIFEEKLSALIHKMPALARDEQEEIEQLNHETAGSAVDFLANGLIENYAGMPQVCSYLSEVKTDIAKNFDNFIAHEQVPDIFGMQEGQSATLKRYKVNLLVDNSETDGAPVLYEDNPVYQKLVGRIEHESRMGALFTDFTLIKSGALLQANGGYLMLDARKLLSQPFAWDALKRALYANQVCIQSINTLYGFADTVSLEPAPVPLDIKIVLLGDRYLYYLLLEYDHDFRELFKVVADFESDMVRDEDNISLYARMIASIAVREKMLPFERAAVRRLIEHGARLAEDSEKLTTHMLSIVDLMRESDHWAAKNAHANVCEEDVQQAIDAQVHRADRISQRYQEEIQQNTIIVETCGEAVGVVNGLAVIDMSNFRFAHPMRITALSHLGEGEIIDIAREVELGGAIHSKGVLTLSSFLAARYTRDIPLSVSASLSFEQSYGVVDGDSASMAELCALMSSLSGIPVRQSLAITGSVNQLGQMQAIGGVNEKIEGFYDICKQRGLDGKHGVIIPHANVRHLMLRSDVVESCAAGQFNVYAVKTVDEAIELLTGVPAGNIDDEGDYPQDTVNNCVLEKLVHYSETREKHKHADTDKQ